MIDCLNVLPYLTDQTPLPVMETNIRTKPKADTDTLKVKKNDKKDKGKKKLTKDDISTPTNFRHVGHVGWDPNKGLDVSGVADILKTVKLNKTYLVSGCPGDRSWNPVALKKNCTKSFDAPKMKFQMFSAAI